MTEPTYSIEFSHEIDQLAPALVEVCHALEDPYKSRVGYEQAYKFADLQQIMAAMRPKLQEQGLCVLQPVCNATADYMSVATLVLHTSGQYLRAVASMPPVKVPKGGLGQSCGAAISYLRRYSVCAIFGLVESDADLDRGEEGWDGKQSSRPRNLAATQEDAPPLGSPPPQGRTKRETAAERAALNKAINVVNQAEACETKDEVRALFAHAQKAKLLTIEISPGHPLADVLKRIAEPLPGTPRKTRTETH